MNDDYRDGYFNNNLNEVEEDNTNSTVAGDEGYGNSEYSTQQGVPSSGDESNVVFNEDGSYHGRYSFSDQSAGNNAHGGYSSTQYINNHTFNRADNGNGTQHGGYYTTPQSYYVPTNNQNYNARGRKSGSGVKAVALVFCILVSSVLGGLVATYINGKNIGNGGVEIKKVVETVTTGDQTGDSMSTESIVEKVANSVVEITTESVVTGSFYQNYITSGAGSGVIISENGYIITNNHVVDGARTIKVTTRDGKSYDAKLVGTASPTLDIALIKIDAKGLSSATMGNSDKIKVGAKAVAIGNPLGQLGGTVTEGIVSALNRDISIDGVTMNLLQTNAEISPGNSGGGLFDGHGNLIGIIVAKSSGSEVEGLGFAIPVNEVSRVVEDLTKYGYVKGIVDSGLSLLDIKNKQTAMMYRVGEIGVYVQSVVRGSKAEQAGFKRGDRIVSVDGKNISKKSEFDSIVKKHKVGDSVTVTVSRDGKTANLKLVLEEYSNESANTSNGFTDESDKGTQNNRGGGLEDFFRNFFN